MYTDLYMKTMLILYALKLSLIRIIQAYSFSHVSIVCAYATESKCCPAHKWWPKSALFSQPWPSAQWVGTSGCRFNPWRQHIDVSLIHVSLPVPSFSLSLPPLKSINIILDRILKKFTVHLQFIVLTGWPFFITGILTVLKGSVFD